MRLLFLLTLALFAHAVEVGQPAPSLAGVTWLKAGPVDPTRGITVVEFWATWCGPCRESIPHLTELSKQYQDRVKFAGLSDEDRAVVLPFIAAQGADMAYPVGVADEPTKTAWMGPRTSIPTAFAVGSDGKVAWIGHPMEGMDEALAQIAAGTWDIGKARASAERAAEGDKILGEIQARLSAGAIDEALALAREHVDGALSDSAAALNGIAWVIVDPAGKVRKQDLDLALKAAERANELTHGKDFNVLDTLARVHFTRGDAKRAVELQRKAVELAKGDAREMLQQALAEYEQAAQKSP